VVGIGFLAAQGSCHMKKEAIVAVVLAWVLSGCMGALDEVEDPLGVVLENDSLGVWTRVEPAVQYNKDNVFELIDGEAELYFPYGFKRVVAVEYAAVDDKDMTVSVEAYELGSLLDAFGVYSNYRDEESKMAEVGTEAVAGSTQVMFYQDRFFVKARTNKTDRQDKLLEFARKLSEVLPQHKAAPPEPALLDIKGAIPMTRQYLAQSVLGYEFFKKGLVAKAFLGEAPQTDVKPLRVFVLMEKTPGEAAQTISHYIAYLDKNQAAHEWLALGGAQVLKGEDPLHKGVLLKQHGPYVLGVAKLAPDMDGTALLDRLDKKVAGAK